MSDPARASGGAAAPADERHRFAFGANWAAFLAVLTDARIARAEASLREMLGMPSLEGKRFLDIGCGSGLFSLAARRLGASVHSFDYDPQSVGCARELKHRYFDHDTEWTIEQGSILDSAYTAGLGRFDVVYSWGVLHHTGSMWQSLENASTLVRSGGVLFIALYNDQGAKSAWWTRVKRLYNRLPRIARAAYLLAFGTALEIGAFAVAIAHGRPMRFVKRWTSYENVRGMSRWHDVVDWVGGYPFEVARPDTVIAFCRARGFTLARLKTSGGKMGCNEFVFERATGR